MSKTFRVWDVDRTWLLPPSVHEFGPAGHLAHFVRDTVREALDLSAITGVYKERNHSRQFDALRMFHGTIIPGIDSTPLSRGLYATGRNHCPNGT